MPAVCQATNFDHRRVMMLNPGSYSEAHMLNAFQGESFQDK